MAVASLSCPTAITWWIAPTGTATKAPSPGSGISGVSGTVSASNSLVGSTGGVPCGQRQYHCPARWQLRGGEFGLGWNKGAVTWGSETSGVAGTVSASNSLVGSTGGDYVGGTEYNNNITVLSNGNYLVKAITGAATEASSPGAARPVALPAPFPASNSLIGSTSGDYVGIYGITVLPEGNYLVDSPTWSGGKGAVTFGCGSALNSCGSNGVTGTVSAANSLTGSINSDQVGGNTDHNGPAITVLPDGNYVVISNSWDHDTVRRDLG